QTQLGQRLHRTPQLRLLRPRQLPRLPLRTRPPHILVVDEQLRGVDQPVHPPEPAQRPARRLPQHRHQLLERHLLGAGARPGPTEPRRPGTALPHHQVHGQVPGRPPLTQRRRLRPHLDQQVAQRRPFGTGQTHRGLPLHVPSHTQAGPSRFLANVLPSAPVPPRHPTQSPVTNRKSSMRLIPSTPAGCLAATAGVVVVGGLVYFGYQYLTGDDEFTLPVTALTSPAPTPTPVDTDFALPENCAEAGAAELVGDLAPQGAALVEDTEDIDDADARQLSCTWVN